jgi:hypothetical protein
MFPGSCFLGRLVGVMLANVSLAVLIWVCGGIGEPGLSSRRRHDRIRR